MTYYYRFTNATDVRLDEDKRTKELKTFLKHVSSKSNWRIVELPNGYYQAEYKPVNCTSDCDDCECNWVDVTRRETVDACERAIDASVDHYKKRLRSFDGPRVVKTFTDEENETETT